MLTFEYDEKTKTIEIFIDNIGRDRLIGILKKINIPGDHDHLMTPSWSGDELSEDLNNNKNIVIHMVTIGIPKA